MTRWRPGQRVIPGVGLIGGGRRLMATKRRGPPQAPKPEHQPLDGSRKLIREELDEQTRADIEALWQKLGGRPPDPQPGPLKLSRETGVPLKADVAAALEALKRPCARCGERFPPSNLIEINGERWCPGCRAARDEQAMTNGGGPA